MSVTSWLLKITSTSWDLLEIPHFRDRTIRGKIYRAISQTYFLQALTYHQKIWPSLSTNEQSLWSRTNLNSSTAGERNGDWKRVPNRCLYLPRWSQLWDGRWIKDVEIVGSWRCWNVYGELWSLLFNQTFFPNFNSFQVHEVITARHCDMKVFAFSLITNKCETDYECQDQGNRNLFFKALKLN